MAICWERAGLLALFKITLWSFAGKEPSSTLFRITRGHLMGKSWPLCVVYDNLVVICWERAGLLALLRITWWSSAETEPASWLCLGYLVGHLLRKSCYLGFFSDDMIACAEKELGPLTQSPLS